MYSLALSLFFFQWIRIIHSKSIFHTASKASCNKVLHTSKKCKESYVVLYINSKPVTAKHVMVHIAN